MTTEENCTIRKYTTDQLNTILQKRKTKPMVFRGHSRKWDDDYCGHLYNSFDIPGIQISYEIDCTIILGEGESDTEIYVPSSDAGTYGPKVSERIICDEICRSTYINFENLNTKAIYKKVKS